jgi:hypothetical protein
MSNVSDESERVMSQSVEKVEEQKVEQLSSSKNDLRSTAQVSYVTFDTI